MGGRRSASKKERTRSDNLERVDAVDDDFDDDAFLCDHHQNDDS